MYRRDWTSCDRSCRCVYGHCYSDVACIIIVILTRRTKKQKIYVRIETRNYRIMYIGIYHIFELTDACRSNVRYSINSLYNFSSVQFIIYCINHTHTCNAIHIKHSVVVKHQHIRAVCADAFTTTLCCICIALYMCMVKMQ